jgi:membrane associated rhomboid family serine protease
LLVAYALSGVLALIAIFLFKNRKQQMLVTRIAAIATIISVVLTVVFFWQDYQTMTTDIVVDDGIGAYTPIVGIILLFLANFYIGKDEKLVRSSYDRLR